ncbi:BON domain-containing protein [Undibacterium sp. CY7W]|uniref:BON domain-containing protein n=2 Tax=Undibacterium rugosum TaxID=2762291 RepID=A0A923I7S2_9BURK|nr:BON domain-containing protein [Undibacterium rugosum]
MWMTKTKWQTLARPVATISLCLAAAASLQGCVELVIGSAVMGTFAATDRRTFGAQTEDKSIVFKGEVRISKALGDNAHVNVNAFNRRALLTGEVADEAARLRAENEMRAVEGVVAVMNEIQVSGISNLSSRSNDALITTKVKATFVDTKDMFASAFKVVTEGGVVFLMGRVTQREGDRAAQVAASISGVRKVVKVFEYISEAELQEMTVKPNTNPSTTTNN